MMLHPYVYIHGSEKFCIYKYKPINVEAKLQISSVVARCLQPCNKMMWPARHHAAAVGLLLKMLDGCCHELLQTFCPVFSTSHFTLRRSSRLATSAQPYLLADTVVYNSLDIFRRSFLGSMTKIWQNEVPICLRQDGHLFGWRTVLKDIQHVMCTL